MQNLSYEQETAQREAVEAMTRREPAPSGGTAGQRPGQSGEVVITGLRLPLSHVVTLALQLAVAAVPAALVWWFLAGLLPGR